MTAGPKCRDLIKRSEDEAGFLAGHCTKLKAYRCPSGLWTCGWGHTRGISEETTCTPEEADRWLDEEITAVEEKLCYSVRVPVTQGMWDALVSFTYNIRRSQWNDRDCRLLRWLNAGMSKERVAPEFDRWIYGTDPETKKKVKLPGLAKRRAAEKELFLS